MSLSCGIIGLPTVGKTTLFNLLTKAGLETSDFMTGKTSTHVQIAHIPDERIDYLAKLNKAKRVFYATLQVTDVPGLIRGSSQGMGAGNEFLQAVEEVEALIHVVRAFDDDAILHVEGSIDLLRDLETINLELLFADLQLIEKRINRINQGKKQTPEQVLELQALEKLQEAMEEEKPLSQIALTDEEADALKHIKFLTEKPMILVINVDETQLVDRDYPQRNEVHAYAEERGLPLLEVCLKAEVEIDELGAEDQEMFLEDLGIEEPGIKRIAQTVYEHLGLISFLTAGEVEVRAWTIRKGLTAREAAGKIHSDIERGFIRAETVSFADLAKYASMTKVREMGLARLEGKDYIVQDGDIINFRFNV